MFKKLIVIGGFLGLGVFLSGCSLKKAPAALQINTTPVSNVFVDGKLLGKTPYHGSDLKSGEVSIKLIPESESTPLASWEGKVKLNNGILTLIERGFGSSESLSSAQILTLEKIKDKKSASLTLVSDPDGALVHLDGEARGFTPLTLEKVGVGDHQITVSKEGYLEKTIKARAVIGFRLIANIKLAQEADLSSPPIASGTPSPSVTPKTQTSPTPEVTKSADGSQVLIKETPTGWLRVRASATTTSAELAKVDPGEKYPLLEETTGWFKIEYETGKEGWVSRQYATKI